MNKKSRQQEFDWQKIAYAFEYRYGIAKQLLTREAGA